MIIQAKFKSVCPDCQQQINVGDKVEWSKGVKAIHEQCKLNKQVQKEKEWYEQAFRFEDTIEVLEDIPERNWLGELTGEILAPKGTKGKIIETKTSDVKLKGKLVSFIFIEEKVRKNQKNKTKTGYFKAPLDQIKITKKAKF